VQGGGSWFLTAGLPGSGQNVQSLSINASIDPQGEVRGVISWTWATNPLPGNGGKLANGYPWVMAVDTMLVLSGSEAYLEDPVTRSGQAPSDVGTRVEWFVKDTGNDPDSPPDEINGTPIEGGNFTVHVLPE